MRKTLRLNPDQSHLVRRADLVALAIERRDLFGACERDWHLGEFAPTSAPCERIQHGAYDTRIRPSALIRWETARDRFLALLAELDVAAGFEPAEPAATSGLPDMAWDYRRFGTAADPIRQSALTRSRRGTGAGVGIATSATPRSPASSASGRRRTGARPSARRSTP